MRVSYVFLSHSRKLILMNVGLNCGYLIGRIVAHLWCTNLHQYLYYIV